MRRDDNPAGSGGARRIYRFHLGWASAGRVNHFNLAEPPRQKPGCARDEMNQRTPGGNFPGNESAEFRTSGQAGCHGTRHRAPTHRRALLEQRLPPNGKAVIEHATELKSQPGPKEQ